MTKDGEPLLSGRIVELGEDTLTLGRLPGELSFKTAPPGRMRRTSSSMWIYSDCTQQPPVLMFTSLHSSGFLK